MDFFFNFYKQTIYVEILIEMEGCDIAYESRRVKAKKKRIERQIREEHEARQQKIRAYIEKIGVYYYVLFIERKRIKKIPLKKLFLYGQSEEKVV